MKNLLILITIMLVSGCGADKQTLERKNTAAKIEDMEVEIKRLEEENRKLKAKAEAYEKALRDSVVGEYEYRFSGTVAKDRYVFQENGKVEILRFGFREDLEGKWSVVDGEIQIIVAGKIRPDVMDKFQQQVWVIRINPDKSLTHIAIIDKDGKRTTHSLTWKKIK
jgi:hypothetical protein